MTAIFAQQNRQAATQQVQPARRRSILPALTLMVALGTVVFGAVLVAQMWLSRILTAAPGQDAQVGGLTFRVENFEWVAHDHSGDDPTQSQTSSGDNAHPAGQGFPMPASMMPGAPEAGNQRLQVQFTLQNLTKRPYSYGPQEFRLVAANGDSWAPQPNEAFRPGKLGPGQALDAALFFDVAETSANLALVLERNGERVQVFIGDPGSHPH
ncbi:MAG: hypothetical protein Fur0044_06380 [Anaerolineae bacterium]